MKNVKISDLMRLQDEYMQRLTDGKAGRHEIRDAIALMRVQLNIVSVAIRHGRTSSRIAAGCDFVPEVFFTEEASLNAKKVGSPPPSGAAPWEDTKKAEEVMPWEEADKSVNVVTPKKKGPK